MKLMDRFRCWLYGHPVLVTEEDRMYGPSQWPAYGKCLACGEEFNLGYTGYKHMGLTKGEVIRVTRG